MNYPDIITFAIPAFVGLILLELYLITRRSAKGQSIKGYEPKDTFASLAMGIGNQVVGILGASALVYVSFLFVYQFRLIDDMPVNWGIVLLCFLADDFVYYWWHRIAHERRWFWASHVNHHSSQHYNLSTALRQPWTGKLSFSFIFGLPLAFIGFPPEMVIFVGAVNLVYQFWIHTELIDRLPAPIELIFNTPSHHRVHHATNPDYLDANYAGTLIIWDRLFGTFVAETDEKPVYGIVKNLTSFNPIVIAFHEWSGVFKDVRAARSFKEAMGYLMGPPGWSPDGSRLTSKMIKERARGGAPLGAPLGEGPARDVDAS